ncbi:hypothetical protein [Nitrosopumilus sp.]|uniref:hypothetical protein n=1 Tax=Nitrosopumilus sp. TaxID=2024843 RepID=UPI0034A00152
MKTKLSKKRAISTVLTTVIILVSSVVLGSGVVLYGTSLFQGGTQTENIQIAGTKLWVHTEAPDGLAWGAAGIRNTGDKVVSVDKIQIRGADIPFSLWYPDTSVTSNLFQLALNHTGWSGVTGSLVQDDPDSDCGTETLQSDLDGAGGEAALCANAASGPVSLNPGQSVMIYFKLVNGTITSLDSGISTTVSIFAGKAGGPSSITVAGVSP